MPADLTHHNVNYWGDKPKNLQSAYLAGLLMWILDDQGVILDITASAAKYTGWTPIQLIGHCIDNIPLTGQESVITHAILKKQRRNVLETGIPATSANWIRVGDGPWIKLIYTQTKLRPGQLFVVAHDITEQDPKARWLRNIDLRVQRMTLDDDKHSISFSEFMVLYHLMRRVPWAEIARLLHVSKGTIGFRLDSLKATFAVDTVAALMDKIASSGIIHLLAIDLQNMTHGATDELELYQRIADFPLDPTEPEPEPD